ncbi:MAG TPA: lipoyl(octanoyl) transferase LipB [Solirubrobacteraceae bacterium]|jgi:lipoyl(octanoyl) transferase
MTCDELWVCHLGTVPYLDAVALQEHVRAQRQTDKLPDTLLLLEHPPVYTRGRRASADELTMGEDFYRARGIDVVDTDRGGRITYHGPGQLVGYPIMRIADIGSYLRTMEAAIVAALGEEGIAARSRCAEGPDYTGVWVEDRKIASIGVHVSRGVTTHGFAVNVNNDLDPFSWVVACGLPDVAVTSIADELRGSNPRHADYDSAALDVNEAPGVARFRKRMAHAFSEAHNCRQRLVSPRRVGIDTPITSPPARQVVPA